jgi:hypothetical protein
LNLCPLDLISPDPSAAIPQSKIIRKRRIRKIFAIKYLGIVLGLTITIKDYSLKLHPNSLLGEGRKRGLFMFVRPFQRSDYAISLISKRHDGVRKIKGQV